MSGIIGGAGSKSGVIGETELDYEVGLWTPSILMATTQITDHSDQYGHYVRIGDLVSIYCACWCSVKGSPVGYMYIAGIPFDVFDGANSSGPATGKPYVYNIGAGSHKNIYVMASANKTYIEVMYNDESSGLGAPTGINESHFGTYPSVMFSLTYRIKSKII